ncbi:MULTISPECIES: hypothetical protein [Cupriavidus]
MTDPVFHKTEQGHDEIRTRARKLDHKTRALLLIVNGERPRSALLAQTSGMGVGPEAIEALLAAGLIRADAAAAPEMAAPAAARHAGPQTAGAGRNGADSVFPLHPTRSHDSGHGDAGPATYQQLYHFYTDVIGHHLGLRGYVLQVKVEKAAGTAELAALRDPLYAALQKARGEITAAAIIGQLDRMVGGEGQAQA